MDNTYTVIKDLVLQGNTLVKINIRYPFSGNEKIDAYITSMVKNLESFGEKKLLPRAQEIYKTSEKFSPFSLVVSYKISIDSENFFSFCFDVFVWQNSQKSRVRRIPLNFDKRTSTIFFPLEKQRKCELLSALEIAAKKTCVSGAFYADAVKIAKKHFKKTNALLTPRGICITYDGGILAPEERGAVNIFIK